MSFQKDHINVFVVASGDSDFSPLVSKLKENNKYVIGMGVKNSTSDLLTESCDEFIFYEDLVRGSQQPLPQIQGVPAKLQECFGLLVDAILALQRENKEILWGSMVKETMKRKKPSFSESYYGFRTFSHLLQDAQRRNIVTLRRDQRSGSYVIEDTGDVAITESTGGGATKAEPKAAEPASSRGDAAKGGDKNADSDSGSSNGRSRRRRSRGRRGRGSGAATSDEATATNDDVGTDEDDDAQDATPEESARAGADKPDERAAEAPSKAQPEKPFSLFSWMRREPEPDKDPED
jgi:hypothetical protein